MGDTALLQSHCPFNMTIKQIKGHGNHRSMVIEKFVTHLKGSVQSSQLFFFDPFKTGYTARAPTSAVLNYTVPPSPLWYQKKMTPRTLCTWTPCEVLLFDRNESNEFIVLLGAARLCHQRLKKKKKMTRRC
jgi:hypothetical protein